MFVDEWHVSQLSSLFQYIPYRLFVSIKGSNDGIILFMRSLAVAIALIFYCFFYVKLREYRVWGILVAYLLCIYFPGGLFAISYYTVLSMQ